MCLGVAVHSLPMQDFQTRRMLAGSGVHQKQKNRKWRRKSARKNPKNARRRRKGKLMQTKSKLKVDRLFLKRIDLMACCNDVECAEIDLMKLPLSCSGLRTTMVVAVACVFHDHTF